MLFNEPKLLKRELLAAEMFARGVSVLFNEPKLLKSSNWSFILPPQKRVSVLFNEPKLLKKQIAEARSRRGRVSVLFNEPKLLKTRTPTTQPKQLDGFSALQRAEIAEKERLPHFPRNRRGFQCSSTSRNC